MGIGDVVEPIEEVVIHESEIDYRVKMNMMELAMFRLMKISEFPKVRRTLNSDGNTSVVQDYPALTYRPGTAQEVGEGIPSRSVNTIIFSRANGASIFDYDKGITMLIRETNSLLVPVEKNFIS